MGGDRIAIQLDGAIKRRDGSRVVAAFHIGLAKTDESIGKRWIKLGNFSKLNNRLLEFLLFLCSHSCLQMLRRLARRALPCKPQEQEGCDHGFSGSRTSRN